MRDLLHTNVLRALAIVMLLWSFEPPSGRAGEIWDGGGANDNIDTAENWDGDTLPALTGGSANLVFAGTTRLTPFTNIRINPLTIEFAQNAGAFSVQGIGGIVTGTSNANGNIYNCSPIAQTFAAPVAVNRGVFYAIDGDLVFNGAVNVGNGSNASGRSLSINGDHDVYFNGLVDGTGTSASSGGVISKLGPGTWYITSNSPLWAGRIGIDEGVLRISAPDALGDPNSRTLVQGGGATGKSRLELAGNVAFAPERLELTGRETGSSPVHLRNFSGNNTWTGDAVLLSGGAEYGFESASGKLTITGNVVNRTGNATARTIRLSGVADGEFAGEFLNDTGTGALTIRKEGSGKWSFSNPLFSYTGDTFIQAGSLAFASGFSLGNSPNIQIASGATLETMDGNLILGSSQSLVGAGTVRGNAAGFGSTITPDVPGTANTAATLAFANNLSLNGGGTIRMDLGDTPAAGGTSDLVEVGGNVAFAGTTTIAITPIAGGLASGTYRLMNYAGSLSGDAANLQLSMLSPIRQTATVDTAAPHQVNLVVTGAAANLVWTGDGTFNSWNVNTSSNWTRGGPSADVFLHLDRVTFDDRAGAANTSVNIAETVVPDTVTVNGSLDYVFTGTGKISGGARIEKSGDGKLVIATDNDHFGPTTINAGTLQVGAGSNTGSLGSGPVINNGALVFNRTTSVTVPGVISGNGTLEKRSSSGTVILTGNNTYSGTTTISAGTLQIGDGGASGTPGTGDVIDNGTLNINRGTDAVIPNQISGTGELAKNGAGFVQLTGANTYAGPTTINGASSQGGLVVANLANGGATSDIGASTSDAANLLIRTGATFRYIGPGAVTDRLFTIGNATIDASGSGALVFNNPGTMGTSGGNRTLTLTGANTDENMLAAAIVDSGPTGITTLVKAGDGTWLLSGANTYSGATTVQAGTLRLASGGALGATSAATTITGDVGGTGSLALTGGITFAPEPITLQARQDLTAPIPHLVNSSGDNHWTGPITLTSGGFEYTLQSDAGTLIIDSDITQSIASLERILNLQGDGNGMVNGAIINGGGSQVQVLRKRGTGTWTLNGANTYRGATIVEQGTLLANSGLTGPGPTIVGTGNLAATLIVNGMQQSSVTVGAASRVNLRAGSATAVVASLSLAGTPDTPTATVDLTNSALVLDYPAAGPNPAAGVRQQIISGRGGSGLGKPWNGPGITSSKAQSDVTTSPNSTSVGYAVNGDLPLGAYSNFRGQSVDATSVLIRYTRTADANLDGVVNDNDVTIVGANYAPGIPKAAWALGDFDYNGFVDDDDVTLLGVFYNPSATPIPAPEAVAPGSATLARGSAGGQSGAATVPEPASWLLLTLIGAAAMLFGCRWRATRAGRIKLMV